MKTTQLISVLLTFFQTLALAGDKVGNGGDVVFCENKSPVVLDLYQGSANWGFEIPKKSGDRFEIIQEVLKGLKDIDAVIYRKLLKRSQTLEIEISKSESNPDYKSSLLKFTKSKLINISDEGVAEMNDDCKLIQAATQIQVPFPGEKKFTFQLDVWNQLDTHNQAALILHEAIYEHMISVYENSSRSTRYFNAALFAHKIKSTKEYFAISKFFDYKNLELKDEFGARTFGAKNICRILFAKNPTAEQQPFYVWQAQYGWKFIATNVESNLAAVKILKEKIIDRGLCD